VNKALISSAGFFADNSIKNGKVYQYMIQAIDSSYNMSAFASDTISAWPAVKNKVNFPIDIGEKAIGADNNGLAVYDFDNDKKQEIIVAGGHGILKIYNCEGDLIRSIDNLKGYMNKPAIGNVYGSDDMEIVVSAYEKRTENNYVYIIDPLNGNVIETLSLNYHQPSSPVLKDLDHDSYDDIIILSHGNESPIEPKNSRLNIWQSSGTDWIVFPGWTEQGYLFEGTASLGMPVAADMTGEGIISVIVPTIEGKIYAFKPNQSAEPEWIKSFPGMLNVPLSLADINRDGNLEMALASINMDRLYLLNYLGEPLSGWETGLNVSASNMWYYGSPAIMANLDSSDPQLEIVYIGRDSAYVFKHTGEELNNWPVAVNNGDDFFDEQHRDLSVNSCPVIGDLNQDDTYEIVFVTQDGYIHALNSMTAKEIIGFPVNSWNDEIRGQSPLIADVDYNGDLDLLFVDHGNLLHYWDLGAKYTDNFMLFASQPYFNFRHTGELDTIILNRPTDINETLVNLPEHYSLEQNYPNPFNPNTTILYTVGAHHDMPLQYIDLSIYNILGQKVSTLVSQFQLPGVYKVTWDSKSSKNIPLSSGIYIYSLVVKNKESEKIIFQKQNKMILLK
ncbi:MAG: T9SS type A sorting domain-containing protein, partial [Calditrichaceae bacterium]